MKNIYIPQQVVLGIAALAFAGCAATAPVRSTGRDFPPVLWTAPFPHEAAADARDDPRGAAGFVRAALVRLDPANPGGPDEATAGRFFLQAGHAADPEIESGLRRASFRAAARAALRSGDRRTYVQAVNGWESLADFNDRQGELRVHLAIRARLRGDEPYPGVRLPSNAAKLIQEAR
jgi:hypothetical protein